MLKNIHSNDKDYLLALQLQLEFENSDNDIQDSPNKSTQIKTLSHEKVNLIDPDYEFIDPNPDIRALFLEFNEKYFYSKLGSCTVDWSKRMTICAGIFYLREGGIIRLSEPLLKLRPRSDLIQTLLHEMIHAYLYITRNFKDRDGHGDEFKFHMNRINKEAGTKITIYHSFHDEVNYQRQHVWRCNGPCRDLKPFFGYVKRSMNRAPGKNDIWWAKHQATCNGTFEKIAEPESFKDKKKRKAIDDDEPKKSTQIVKKKQISDGKGDDFKNTLDSFFSQGKASTLIKLSQPTQQFKKSNDSPAKIKTFVKIDTFLKTNKEKETKSSPPNKNLTSEIMKKSPIKIRKIADDDDDDIQIIDAFVNRQVECPMCGLKVSESTINSHVFANHLINDHKADAFNPPEVESLNTDTINQHIRYILNGFKRWDAIHFTFIAQNGYIFEHSVAFFPLFPITIRLFNDFILTKFLFIESTAESILLSAIVLNLIYFTLSVVFLFKLTKIIFGDNSISYYSSVIFCLNPANIFFTAPYSESLFSMLTFMALYYLFNRKILFGLVFFALGCFSRSNGLVNFIYVVFILLLNSIKQNNFKLDSKTTKIFQVLKKLIAFFLRDTVTTFKLILFIVSSFLTLLFMLFLYQYYIYFKFCLKNDLLFTVKPLNHDLIKYAKENFYDVYTNKSNQPEWCQNSLPFSYTSVQSKYWNVGLLRYWTLKQIPNFILAFPILAISSMSLRYFISRVDFKKLLNFNLNNVKTRIDAFILPFILHQILLLISCIFFMHVQVSTRFICSSNPINYWYVAKLMDNSKRNFSNEFGLKKLLKFCSCIYNDRDRLLKLILLYFLFYTVFGTLAFVNFYPFT